MLRADLHTHSTVSDGSESIDALIKQAVTNKVDILAITDHDTLSHKKQIPLNTPIPVITGIEISAIDPETRIKAHILGYHITNDEIVEAVTIPILKRRHQNSVKQIEILNANGYTIDLDALNRADGKYIYKQHIMEYLVNTGQVSNRFGVFYNTVFKNGGICDFDIEYANVYDAVAAITKAGGKAVLAHPGLQKNFYLIERLLPMGLVGVEYNHSGNSEDDKKIIKCYAKKYNLFLTGGSDYHGRNEKVERKIGDFVSEESGIHALCLKST